MLNRILFVLLIALNAQAEVIETNKYEDVLKHLTADTLFVSDLDNTIIRPPQTLGSDQWGSAQQKWLKELGMTPEQGVDVGVALFTLVQFKTTVIPVEPETPAILEQIAARGIPTLGLTARPLSIVDRTLVQLNSIKARLTGVGRNPALKFEGETVIYKNGILFVGPKNNKGQVLKEFLRQNPMPNIKRIIFIDDKAHHTADVDAAFANSAYQVKAFRYGAADVHVKSYDAELAKKQWDIFVNTGKIVPDSDL